MRNLNRKVAILGGVRIPFVKSFTAYQKTTHQEMMTFVLQNLVQKMNLKNEIVGEVTLGAVMKSSADWNLARECVLGSGLSPYTPAYDQQRACGTSLEAANHIALKIATGQIESGIAAGTDTNSDLPVMIRRSFTWKLMELRSAKSFSDKLKIILKFRLSDLKLQFPAVNEPRTGLSMGEHTEQMVKEWQITRDAQDQLALKSHHNAARAISEGFLDGLLVEFKGQKKDAFVRGDTTLEKLAKLKPAFDFSGRGTLTAGNSTPLTDGAAAVLLGSEEYAKSKNLEVLAYITDMQAAAVDYVAGEGLLMAPTRAVADMLKRNNLKLQDFDFYEIHEAFAGQVLCTLKAWESEEYCREKLGLSSALGSIDLSKLNVNGSSLAYGHPFAATGARILAMTAKLLNKKGRGRALISICTAGGMGVVAIVEKN